MTPLMTTGDIAVWESIIDALPDTAHIAEVGVGNSSVWLLARMQPTQRYTGVDHVEKWADVARGGAANHPHAEVRHVPVLGHCGSKEAYASRKEEANDGSANAYIAALDDVAGDIDCLMVDGICRADVLTHLRSRLRPGTVVCLHDFTGREDWYRAGTNLYETVTMPTTPNSLLVLRVPEDAPS